MARLTKQEKEKIQLYMRHGMTSEQRQEWLAKAKEAYANRDVERANEIVNMFKEKSK